MTGSPISPVAKLGPLMVGSAPLVVESDDLSLMAVLEDRYMGLQRALEFDHDEMTVFRLTTTPPETPGARPRSQVVGSDGTASPPGTAEWTLLRLTALVNRFAATSDPDRLHLHAGAVRLGERSVALIGRSGSGKSTLTAALVSAGAEYQGDEMVAVGPGGVTPVLLKPLTLSAASCDALEAEWPHIEIDPRWRRHRHEILVRADELRPPGPPPPPPPPVGRPTDATPAHLVLVRYDSTVPEDPGYLLSTPPVGDVVAEVLLQTLNGEHRPLLLAEIAAAVAAAPSRSALRFSRLGPATAALAALVDQPPVAYAVFPAPIHPNPPMAGPSLSDTVDAIDFGDHGLLRDRRSGRFLLLSDVSTLLEMFDGTRSLDDVAARTNDEIGLRLLHTQLNQHGFWRGSVATATMPPTASLVRPDPDVAL